VARKDNIWHVKFWGKPPRESAEGAARQVTAGVPLPKLIKRRLSDALDLVMLNDSRSVAAERFRRLKTILNHQERTPQVIVVTSASPAEGKSFVSINLALAFASEGQGEVLLVDSDLRRPSLGQYIVPPPKIGFTELLEQRTELEHVTLELENTPLRIIPAGVPPRDPVDLLPSRYTADVLATLRERFERIIIDTPPVVPFTDADIIGALSDGILIVARRGATRRGMLQQAVASISSTRVLGTVLNDVTFSLADADRYYSADHYHEYYRRAPESE
jgi:receptor protein-tyrosine kinase